MINHDLLTQNLNAGLDIAKNYLNIWSLTSEPSHLFASAFGNAFNRSIADILLQNWQIKDSIEFPEIKIVSRSEINNANGAYARDTKTIYLAQELLLEGNNRFTAGIILEEYGHHLDALLNTIDTSGDEGAIFSALVRGKKLTSEQLQTIRVEDDNAVVVLNGQPVRIEQAASFPYSEEGTTNSSSVTLDTGGSKGKITLAFETYRITDQVQILYEGRTLYNSGFVGTQGVDTITREFDGDSSEIVVRVTPNSNDGTAWYYTVSAEVEQCPETGNLNIEAVNGNFEDTDNDGDCDAEGTINIGRSDGMPHLITVRKEANSSEVMSEHDRERLTVNNGVVYAQINNISQPLFKANLSFPFGTSISDSFTEESEVANDFTIAGLEIDFDKLRLDRNQIKLEGAFSLPDALGYLDLNLNAPNALIISSDNIRIDGGNLSLPTEEFRLFNAFAVKAENTSIEYSPIGTGNRGDELKIQGKFGLVTPFFKSEPDSSGAEISLDLSGSNYLKIVDGQAEVNGEFLLENVKLTSNWEIQKLSLSLTTEDGAVTDAAGVAEIKIPWSPNALIPDGTGIAIEAGFTFPDSGLELDNINIEANDLDLPIGSTGILLQKLSGGLDNLAPSNSNNVEFDGSVGLTYGPELNLSLDDNFFISGNFSGAAISLDIDGIISEDNLVGGTTLTVIDNSVFEFRGLADFQWEDGSESLTLKGGFSALAGIFQTPNFGSDSGNYGSNIIDFDIVNKRITALAGVAITFPETSFFEDLRGKQSLNAKSFMNFTNDGDNSNDYFTAWGNFTYDPIDSIDLGILEVDAFAGLRVYFNGDLDLFRDELPADISDDIEEISVAQLSILPNEPFQFSTEQQSSTGIVLSASQDNSTQLALSQKSATVNNFDKTTKQDELLKPQLLAQSSSFPQFEETITISDTKESVIILSVFWDNSVDPKEVPLLLLTPNNGVIEEADFSSYYPDIFVAGDSSDDDRKFIVVKNPAPGEWGIAISNSNQTELGNVDMYAKRYNVANTDPTLEILDISQNADGSEVTVTYEARDPDTATKFDLYYSTENEGYNFSESWTFVSDLPENEGIGTYTWNTEGVKPGEYYIFGRIQDRFDLPLTTSNYSAQTVEISNETDVSVDISANGMEEAVIGEEVTYTATVSNNGEINANDLRLFITLDDKSSFVSTSVATSEPQDRVEERLGDLMFRIEQLAPGENKTFEIIANAANEIGTFVDADATAYITTKTYDPNSDNNTAKVNVSVIEAPKFKPFVTIERIDRNAEGERIEPETRIEIPRDEPYTYEVTVTNTGEGTATGVTIKESFADLAHQLGQITPSQGDYSIDPQTGELIVNFGEIAPGETETVSISITPDKAYKTSSTSTLSYNEKQVTDEVTTSIKVNLPPVEPADLELSQTVDNMTPLLGEEINITLTLVNKGPGVAAMTEVTNLLPDGLSFVRANAALGTYDPATGIWNSGNIRDGARTYLTITALVEDVGSIVNQAEITSDNQQDPDSTPGNGEVGEDDFTELTITGIGLATDEDTSLTILAAELLDSNTGDNLSIAEITNFVNGTAILNGDGNVEFTPDPNFYGKASFDYTVTDGTDISVMSTDVLIRSVNDILVVNDDVATTNEDTPVTLFASTLFDNDINEDRKDSRIDGISNVDNGTAIINSDGNIEFTPDLDFNGTASFDYTVTDGIDRETASVEVAVNAVNDVPVANDDTFIIDEDTPTTILATELLSNDTDVETLENLSVTEVENAVNGTVSLNGEGNIQFFPDANFNGASSFDYIVSDGTDNSTASVEVIVNPVNDVLVANSDTVNTDEDTSITILASNLFANDINDDIEKSLTITQITNAVNGTAVINSDGNVEFTPDVNFYGTASFDYTVTDGTDLETASVEVVVNAVNDIPVANKDTFTTNEDTLLTILNTELLSNDTDVETQESISVTEVKNAVNGTVIFNDNGEIEFAPDANFYGTASFEYTLTDDVDNNTGLAEIVVNPVNDTPFITTLIPDLNLPKNSPNSIVDYADYFEDIEEKDNLLADGHISIKAKCYVAQRRERIRENNNCS